MTNRLTLIGTLGFIVIGFSFFTAPAFASAVAGSVVVDNNPSAINFIVLALTGFFGFGLKML